MSAYESSIPPVSIDGKFGADTERAVRAYQRFAGLTVDGVVGRTTWNSLYGRASQLRSSGPALCVRSPKNGLKMPLIHTFWSPPVNRH